MIRSNNTTVQKRIKVVYDKTNGIQNYDSDNIYPQRIKNIISNSGTGTACVKLFAKFIKGDGFSDKVFWKYKVNPKQTLDKLFYKLADDYASLHGFAILISYNAFLQPVEWINIPFEFCRQGEKDSEEYNGKIVVYNNWDKSLGKIDKKKFDIIDVYNPRKDVIQAQVDKAGGIEKYKGQIFWYSAEGDIYPKSPLDPVLEDVQTDAEIKNFRNRDVTTNFMGSHMIEYPYAFVTETEREQEKERWQKYQGADNALKMMIVENPDLNNDKPGAAIKVTPFETKNNDSMFQVTSQTTKDSIMQSLGQPPSLHGVSTPGKLGLSDEIRDAFEYYNNATVQDRRVFEEVFMELFEGVRVNSLPVNPSNAFTIIPISFGELTALQRVGPYMAEFNILLSSQLDSASKLKVLMEVYGFTQQQANEFIPQSQESKPALINTIGIGGVTALTSIIQSQLSAEQKVNTLVVVFGISREDASSMVNTTVINKAFT